MQGFLPRSLKLALFLAAQGWAYGNQPNVIVVLTDDLGWSDVAVQGIQSDLQTPHLDALAARGVRCLSGYVTSPQCSPSRAAIVTGRYQQRYGIDTIPDVPLPLEATTLAERLRPLGYRTGFVGKWHLEPNVLSLSWMAREMPELRESSGARPRAIPREVVRRYGPGEQGFHDYFWGELQNYWINYDLTGRSTEPRGYSGGGRFRLEVQTDAAIAFIKRNSQGPFFLHLAYYAPHTPLEATEEYLSRFPGEMPERRRYALAMISAMDDGIGRIVETLREQGQLDNTLIVFTSDNGAPLKMTKADNPVTTDAGGWDGSLNEPWIGEKGMLSDGGVRVPMIFSYPAALPAGKVYAEPVSTLDIAATALAVAGAEPVAELDGVDLMPYLRGDIANAPHDRLFWRFWTQAAVREGDWKFISVGGSREFLFNLAKDAPETVNVVGDHPELVARLRDRLSEWTSQFQPPGIPSGPLVDQEVGWYDFYFRP